MFDGAVKGMTRKYILKTPHKSLQTPGEKTREAENVKAWARHYLGSAG